MNVHGRLVGASADATAHSGGALTIANNAFADRVVIIIGPYEVISNIDYAIGVDEDATAVNLAASISNLPGFTATAVLHTVTIRYWGPGFEPVAFRVVHTGTATNFDPVNPATGFLAPGLPIIAAPVIG
jgi:hypothetical protein